MKLIALAAALAFGGTAIAQTTPTPPAGGDMQTGAPMTPQPGTPAPDAPAPTDMAPTTPPPADPTMSTTPGQPMQQGAPMQPGMPMAGGPVTFAPPSTTPPPQAQTEYPVCSRTVTDQCRNRGGR